MATILAVTTHKKTRKMLQTLANEHRVYIVDTPEEGVEMVKKQYIHLLLMEVERHLTISHQQLMDTTFRFREKHLPCILTSHSQNKQLRDFAASQISWAMVKLPCEETTFFKLITDALQNYAPEAVNDVIFLQHYKTKEIISIPVNDIYAIYRQTSGSHIEIFFYDHDETTIRNDFFIYKGVLSDFPHRYNVAQRIFPAQQRWLVNIDHVATVHVKEKIIKLTKEIELIVRLSPQRASLLKKALKGRKNND